MCQRCGDNINYWSLHFRHHADSTVELGQHFSEWMHQMSSQQDIAKLDFFFFFYLLTAMSSWSSGTASSASSCTEESALTVMDPLLTRWHIRWKAFIRPNNLHITAHSGVVELAVICHVRLTKVFSSGAIIIEDRDDAGPEHLQGGHVGGEDTKCTSKCRHIHLLHAGLFEENLQIWQE